jgi:alkaline phosphatase
MGDKPNKELRIKNYMKKYFLFAIMMAVSCNLIAQNIRIHSHNDYWRRIPFYQAYAQQTASIEADIYAIDNAPELLVAHDRAELPTAPTLDELYIQPLVHLYTQNRGRAWRNSEQLLVLLIDLKTPASSTLNRLIEKLQHYPEVFDPSVNPYAVRVVISGQSPAAETFGDYPACIHFDGAQTYYTPAQLENIYMISLHFPTYTKWNGKGAMPDNDAKRIRQLIDSVHAMNKPIRFWATPDNETSWHLFHSLGVDFINTNRPEACTAFFRDEHELLKQKTALLNPVTIDGVHIGDATSEKAHKMEAVFSETKPSEFDNLSWRHAAKGGYFMYKLKSLPDAAQSLYLLLKAADKGERTFDVLIDGQLVTTINHNQKVENVSTIMHSVIVPIPETFTKGKKNITVKFQAKPGNTAGGIYDLRLIRTADTEKVEAK